jgi:hypothetical protein
MKTSSVTGARAYKKEMKNIVAEAYGSTFKNLSIDDQNKLIAKNWEEFHRQQELRPEVPSDQLLTWFKEKNDSMNSDEMIKYLEERSNERIKQQEQEREELLKDTEYKPKWKNFF